MIAVYIIIGVVVFLIIYFAILYNRLIRMRNEMSNAWAQIEVQLKRRHDLIPNLVETVKGYAAHERETFDAITQARAQAQSALGKGAAIQSETEGLLGGALSRLLAVAERYPELKANENFLVLQSELSSTENRIAGSRESYNNMVLHCNNTIQTFPSNIMAHLRGFRPGEFFQVGVPVEKDTPAVRFS